MNEKTRKPVRFSIPSHGVLVAESIHAPGFRMRGETHGFHELYYLLRGNIRYYEGDSIDPVFLGEGSLKPIGQNRLHRVEDQSAATLLILALSGPYIESSEVRQTLWKAICAKAHEGIRPDHAERDKIERHLRTMMVEQETRRPGYELVLTSETDRLLVALARLPESHKESNSHSRVAGVVRQLEETFFEESNIDSAARRAHLSRRRFSMIFREITGESFLDHRNNMRLDYAARLMREERHTIAGAAFSSGFNDLAHFYRLFKKRFGAPPGKWLGGEE